MSWLRKKQTSKPALKKSLTPASLVCGYKATSEDMRVMYECEWFLDKFSDGEVARRAAQ